MAIQVITKVGVAAVPVIRGKAAAEPIIRGRVATVSVAGDGVAAGAVVRGGIAAVPVTGGGVAAGAVVGGRVPAGAVPGAAVLAALVVGAAVAAVGEEVALAQLGLCYLEKTKLIPWHLHLHQGLIRQTPKKKSGKSKKIEQWFDSPKNIQNSQTLAKPGQHKKKSYDFSN